MLLQQTEAAILRQTGPSSEAEVGSALNAPNSAQTVKPGGFVAERMPRVSSVEG